MYTLLILIGVLILYGIFEYRVHLSRIYSFSIRIHVNGTRGKSSVTRLIAAGLRAGGIKTFAKTTGTKPRMIFENGKETPIYRPGKANIIEQVGVLKWAAKVNALVIECMAVRPEYQRFVERKMIRSTIGVITNVRQDHIEEMGPTLEDIGSAICGTIPKEGILFTAEKQMLPMIQKEAEKKGTQVVVSNANSITDDMMCGFSYIEHKENVALALKVVEHFGINPDVALKGMWTAEPDPGVLRRYRIKYFEREIEFINAFAANDPDSTMLIWNKIVAGVPAEWVKIVILVCRSDRLDRSKQLGELIAKKLLSNFYILAGSFTDVVEKEVIGLGLSGDKLFNMGDSPPDCIFEKVLELTRRRSLVFGIGNIVGYGETIVTYFKNRGEEKLVN